MSDADKQPDDSWKNGHHDNDYRNIFPLCPCLTCQNDLDQFYKKPELSSGGTCCNRKRCKDTTCENYCPE